MDAPLKFSFQKEIMVLDQFHPKQQRIIQNDVSILFSRSAFLRKPTIEQITDIFRPTVNESRGTLWYSDKAIDSLNRLTRLIFGLSDLSQAVISSAVYEQLLSTHKQYIGQDVTPTAEEYVSVVITTLRSTVKSYKFLICVEGLVLKGLPQLQLGSVRIQHPDPKLFETIKFGGMLPAAPIFEQFNKDLWLIGDGRGDRKIATERFELRALQVVGLLAVCGAILYRGAIWRSRVRAVISPNDNRRAISILSWEQDGEDPSLNRRMGDELDLEINTQQLSYLTDTCYFQELASLSDQAKVSELQEAILRAIYWFGDAYRDPNRTMKFVKLWSCAEAFFAIEKEGVADLNTTGLATVLTFGGFGIIAPADYARARKRIRDLYDHRSRALHRGTFGGIEPIDLNALSFWMAWLIISMASLCERGYSTFRQVREQTVRLDKLGKTNFVGRKRGTGREVAIWFIIDGKHSGRSPMRLLLRASS